MEYAQEARPRRPQLGVRYGLEGFEPSRRTAGTWKPASGLARHGAMDAVAPRSAATLWEPTASPWFYPRLVAVMWLVIGVVMAFASTSIGYVLLVGHELRRSVAAAFVVGLVETAASLSLGMAFWGRITRTVLILSIAFGAFLVLTGLLAPPLGFVIALAAGVIVLMSLVMLRDYASQEGIAVQTDAEYPDLEFVDVRELAGRESETLEEEAAHST
jgi:hypothetical protein